MRILQDIFPALITIAAADTPTPAEELTSAPYAGSGYRQINTARILVTDERVMIFTDSASASEGPQLLFSEEVDAANFSKAATQGQDSYVTTISGKKLAFKKDLACGCGSRLRSFNPFRYMSSTKDPTE